MAESSSRGSVQETLTTSTGQEESKVSFPASSSSANVGGDEGAPSRPTLSTSGSTAALSNASRSRSHSLRHFQSASSHLDEPSLPAQPRSASTDVPIYPSLGKSSAAAKAARPIAHPVRSVTISESHIGARKQRKRDEAALTGLLPRSHLPRSHSETKTTRRSLDVGPRRSGSLARRSLSLGGLGRGETTLPDPLREPRRSVGKRPEEFDLRARDPRNGTTILNVEKGISREVPFGAPYSKSGVVFSSPASWSDFLVPGPLTLGHGQWWYLIAGQSIIAAVISGAINFGVGCATYNSYKPPIVLKLWQWVPVPLAGDMGVTVILQQIISMLITSALVHHDLTDGPIGPLRRPWPPLMHLPSTPSPRGSWLGCKLASEVPEEKPLFMGKAEGKGKFSQYGWWLVRASLMGSERNDLLARGISWRQRCERILWTAVQGFILCLLTFPWFWPLAIAIVAPIYQDRNLAGTWIPPIVKLLYGGIMAMLTNPIMALLAMGAESSVRRAYPELDLWQPFGGQADYQAWLIEQNLSNDDVEIGPNGLARSSVQLRRTSEGRWNNGGSVEEEGHLEEGGGDSAEVVPARSTDPSRRTSLERDPFKRNSGGATGRSGLVGGTDISKAITEEQGGPSLSETGPSSKNLTGP